MEINPNLGFAFLDRLLGGPGIAPSKIRSLTEIEQTVIERLAQRMLDHLQEPWGSIVELYPTLERVETNPQFTQLVSPTEIMIIVSVETRMNDILGMVNICIPFLVLEPVLDKLTVHYYYSVSNQKSSPENQELIKNRLENTVIPVRAILGKTTITVKDLIELSMGDVIPLERTINDELEVVIGQRTKFLGKPGVFGKRVSIQVSQVIKEEGEYE